MLIKTDVRGVDLSYLISSMTIALETIQGIWGSEDIILINAGDAGHSEGNTIYKGQFICVRPSVFTSNNCRLYELLSPLGYEIYSSPERIYIGHETEEA